MQKLILLSLVFSFSIEAKKTDILNCTLSDIASVTYTKGKVKAKANKERAVIRFSGLKTSNPKMLHPDNIPLVKIHENNGVLWLSSLGSISMVTYTIDTRNKLLFQSRTSNFAGMAFVGNTWFGKCR